MFHLRILIAAFLSLRQNLLRTMLATLGVVIGVGAVVAAVSILEGSQRWVLDRVEALGADQLLVINGSEERSHRRMQKSSLLPEDATRVMEDNPGQVVAVAPQANGGGQIKYFQKNTFVTVLGTTAAYATINSYTAEEGRFITDPDVQGKSMVCVLGYKVAADLFGALPAVGRRVKVNGKGFVVVGVMEEKGALGFVEVDTQIIVPISTAMGRMFGQRYLSMIVVQCAEARDLPICIEGVKKTLRSSHRIKAGRADDFVIFTQERMKQEFSQFAKLFAIVRPDSTARADAARATPVTAPLAPPPGARAAARA